MDIGEKWILNLIEGIYENARNGDPRSWFDVYDRFARMVGSGPGGLSVVDADEDILHIVASDYDGSQQKAILDHYQHVCPLRPKIASLKVGGRIRRSEEVSDREWEKSEVYHDFFRKHDVYQLDYYSLCSIPGFVGGLTITKPRSNPTFSAEEQTLLEICLPHIRRGFDLFLQFGRIRRSEEQKTETLCGFPQPFVVVDRARRVAFLNDAAEEILATRDGLERNKRDGAINAVRAKDTRTLVTAIEQVFSTPRQNTIDEVVDPTVLLQIARRSAARPLQLLITPFTKALTGSYTDKDLVLIFIFDPDQKRSTAIDMLQQLYSLTPAEARLGALLADGNSVKEAAEILGITENTVRTHLKHLFCKTDTNRQGDLVSLILNGPAAFNCTRK